MKENKKLGTSNTGAVAEPPIQIIDNRKEITELTEAELKELESVTKQFEKGSSEHLKYLRMNFKHIGGEIPKDVPVTKYYRYIIENFSVKKPEEEWTNIDYKIHSSLSQRLLAASELRQQLEKQETPLIERQKRIMERVRNGTDYDVHSSKEFLERLQQCKIWL